MREAKQTVEQGHLQRNRMEFLKKIDYCHRGCNLKGQIGTGTCNLLPCMLRSDNSMRRKAGLEH